MLSCPQLRVQTRQPEPYAGASAALLQVPTKKTVLSETIPTRLTIQPEISTTHTIAYAEVQNGLAEAH